MALKVEELAIFFLQIIYATPLNVTCLQFGIVFIVDVIFIVDVVFMFDVVFIVDVVFTFEVTFFV